MIDINKKLEEIITGQEEKIVTMTLDIFFFKNFLEVHDEDALRKELSEEEDKRVFDKKGEQIVVDNRDKEKIARISSLIEKVKKAKKDIEEFNLVIVEIKEYVALLKNKKQEIIKLLEENL